MLQFCISPFFRLVTLVFFSVLIISCASTDKHSLSDNIVDDSGSYKYDAWKPVKSGDYQAINVLLDEADALMDNQAYNAAADKLERALRIKPEYAPAWSRLSWLALQTNSPKRSVQMAKRSNSFAQANPELQSLNGSFIQAASKTLDDEAANDGTKQKFESPQTESNRAF